MQLIWGLQIRGTYCQLTGCGLTTFFFDILCRLGQFWIHFGTKMRPDIIKYGQAGCGQVWPDMRCSHTWPSMTRYGQVQPKAFRQVQIWADMVGYGKPLPRPDTIWSDTARCGQIRPDAVTTYQNYASNVQHIFALSVHLLSRFKGYHLMPPTPQKYTQKSK